MSRTKKVGSAGRFGARYGLKLKRKFDEVQKQYTAKHICSYCGKEGGLKRISLGIWTCTKCKAKFAGKAYTPK